MNDNGVGGAVTTTGLVKALEGSMLRLTGTGFLPNQTLTPVYLGVPGLLAYVTKDSSHRVTTDANGGFSLAIPTAFVAGTTNADAEKWAIVGLEDEYGNLISMTIGLCDVLGEGVVDDSGR